MENHFELFQLPIGFEVDEKALETAYLLVQKRTHPDRFANASDAEKRIAMQWAIRANEAYQTLKKPLLRAQYLCELQGVDIEAESNTAMPMDFLMQQMQWREELAEAKQHKDVAALEVLHDALHDAHSASIAHLAVLFNKTEMRVAATEVRQLMFLEKLQGEIDHALAQLDA